ncbi:hypothetical protein SUGI_0941130 [Cryptomeria japonica]|nr:hypothetical protein SUGI_0941130 [Cryptomeria japonica]
MAKRVEGMMGFEDCFLVMANELDKEEFMGELYSGFHLLAYVEKGMITLQILKKTKNLLGMEEKVDNQLKLMIEAADLNGDEILDQNEFLSHAHTQLFLDERVVGGYGGRWKGDLVDPAEKEVEFADKRRGGRCQGSYPG